MQVLLGFNGLTIAADQILEGTLFENTDEECFLGVREFVVAAMAIPKELKGIPKVHRNSKRDSQSPQKFKSKTSGKE